MELYLKICILVTWRFLYCHIVPFKFFLQHLYMAFLFVIWGKGAACSRTRVTLSMSQTGNLLHASASLVLHYNTPPQLCPFCCLTSTWVMNLSKIPDKRQGWEDSVFLIVYCVSECQKEGVHCRWCISRTTEWFSSHFSEPRKPSNLGENADEETNPLHMSTSTLMRYLLKGKKSTAIQARETELCSFPTVLYTSIFSLWAPPVYSKSH